MGDHVKLEYFAHCKMLLNAWFCFETAVLEKKIDETNLPRALIDTIYMLSNELHREPVLCYEDYILLNSKYVNGERVPLHTFTGLDDEVWFIQIHLMVEDLLVGVISKLHALKYKSLTVEAVEDVLQSIVSSMDKAGAILLRMLERCQPDVFLNTVRKYFAKIPKRFFSPGVSGVYAGASGAQASFEPLLDAFLGIRFPTRDAFAFHSFMPPEDRSLLSFLE
eukprot:gene35152-43338_t